GTSRTDGPMGQHLPRKASLLILAIFPLPVLWSGDKLPNREEPKVAVEPRPKSPGQTPATPRGNIRVDTTLVQIPVTVTTPRGVFVTALEKDNFRIFEDKVEQTIVNFSSEEAPLSVGLVFDCSGSMGSKLSKSRQAVSQFFKTANPQDEFFLVQFNDRPE